jgi:hypothetical protein
VIPAPSSGGARGRAAGVVNPTACCLGARTGGYRLAGEGLGHRLRLPDAGLTRCDAAAGRMPSQVVVGALHTRNASLLSRSHTLIERCGTMPVELSALLSVNVRP